jgi:hypothetical protein
VAVPHFIGLLEKVVGRPYEHSFRRGINRRSRARIEIVRRRPKFSYGSHALSI